jgi:hypothetical protein
MEADQMNFDSMSLPPTIDFQYPRPKKDGGLDRCFENIYGPVLVATNKNANMGMLTPPASSDDGAVLSSLDTFASANPELLAKTQDL